MKKNAYLVYCRKSTDDTQNQKNSIPYQVDECLSFAKKNGLLVAEESIDSFLENGVIREKHTAFKTAEIEFTPDGRVSYKIERPKFQRMAQAFLKGEYKGVICLCWDRISRNEQDDMLIKNLMDNGVDFQFVQVTYDKTSSGALHRDIDGMFAQHYSRVISEKVRNTFEKFRAQGRCLGPAPIGYLDFGSDDKRIDPVRGAIVARIFELYATGEWSFAQLAKWANKEGLTTKPSRARRTRHQILSNDESEILQVSRPITAKTMENLLKNPAYVGKHKGKDGRVWACKHPSLINESLYQKVQKALVSRNVSVHYIDKDFILFRNLVHCSCGRAYSAYEQKGAMYYRSRCKPGCTNTKVNTNEDEINGAIEAFLDRIYFTEEEMIDIELGAHSGLDRIAAKRDKELADLERERKRIYGDLDYLKKNKITLLRNGVSSLEDYANDLIRLEGELAEVSEKMENYREAEGEMLKYVLTFSELVKMASQYYKHALDTEKRDILIDVFTELVFADGEFHFKPKDGYLALFDRHDKTKTTQVALSGVRGSEGGIRTHDQWITLIARFPGRADYIFIRPWRARMRGASNRASAALLLADSL